MNVLMFVVWMEICGDVTMDVRIHDGRMRMRMRMRMYVCEDV